MGNKSNIQWTDATWNIARGCTKVDEDCKYCYMYRDSFDNTRYNPLEVVRTKTVFNLPLKLKEPSKIFTSSLTDVFHPAIDSYRNEMWDIIRKCPQHTFQILTKRPERIIDNTPVEFFGAKNVWLGTSIGSQKSIERLSELIAPITNGIKFLSLEPLHGQINLDLFNCVDMSANVGDLIDWVIIGGESGNETGKYRYRECKLDWIENIVLQIQDWNKTNFHQIGIFVKQLGTYLSKELKMSDRHGGNIDEFPKHLQIREFPKV